MGTTSLGIYYPDPSGVPKRQDFQDMATTTNAAILAAAPIGAWPSYTPVWTASGANPAIGNGSATGRYRAAGALVHFRLVIAMGTTTTYGSGQYYVSLPVAAHPTGTQLVQGEAVIGSAAFAIRGRILTADPTKVYLYCPPTTAGAADRAVSPTTPGTFANGSQIVVTGTYEAAA